MHNDHSPASLPRQASIPAMMPHWMGGSATPVMKTPLQWLFFSITHFKKIIYWLREGYAIAAGTPASIDVWIVAARPYLS
jgi:hypothetical protein